jgi:hypothetical protein
MLKFSIGFPITIFIVIGKYTLFDTNLYTYIIYQDWGKSGLIA